MTERNVPSGAQPKRHHAAGKAKLPLGGGVRHATSTLERNWKQRVGSRGIRPCLVVKSSYEEMVEFDGGRFQHSQHLDRNVVGFRLEQGVGAQTYQPIQRVVVAQGA